MNEKRPLFGVILSTIDNVCQYEIFSGIADYANKNSINLLTYIGSYQTISYDFTSHLDTCLYNIKNNDSLDGVIIFSGFIASMTGNEYIEAYIAEISKNLPVVSVSYELPGTPSVMIDNISGMYDAVEHLIQNHGKKHIAFVKGPDGHPEAEDRFTGYKRALETHGIAYDERYIFPGNFSPVSGSMAVEKLHEMPGLCVDAIVACDDSTATGVLSELDKHEQSVENIAVVGFDDERGSSTFIPSISTVRQDFFSIGQKSAEMLLNQINGNSIEKSISLPSTFIARQSCGCPENELLDTKTIDSMLKEEINKAIDESDKNVVLRRIVSNLVLMSDIESLAEELNNSLPEISINKVLIGLYKNAITKSEKNVDRTIDKIIRIDTNDKIFSNNVHMQNSDSLTVRWLDFYDDEQDLLLFPLFFKDEELGIMLIPFDPGISVNTYETLRINISTAIKGARLLDDIHYQREQANAASKAKSDFLSSMSHEMRTPLNAIIGMTAIAKRANSLTEKDHSLKKIEDASTHLLGVINDVLDVAKIEANKMELVPIEFNFEKMVQKVITLIQFRSEEKQQILTVKIDKEIPPLVMGDEQRLSQVIMNLLSNAVKFTPENGRITLVATLNCENAEECELRISVTDTGIGMSPDQVERLFQPFVQAESGISRKFGGTGLGLVISKRIVELMDGKIWVKSEFGKGTRFNFTIKVKRSDKDDDVQSEDDIISGDSMVANEFEGKRLLLTDDLEINREILIVLLEESGLEIDTAQNGQEALDKVSKATEVYDIIFMDVQMPIMDGFEATRHIRLLPDNKGATVPIIAMTANVFKSDIEACIAAGMNDHFGKPYEVDRVLEILRKYLSV